MNEYRILCSGLLTLVLTFVTGCSNTAGEKFYFKEGLVYNSQTNQLYTGVVKDEFSLIEYHVVNGIKDGFFKTYYNSGKIKTSGNVRMNENVGEWTYYYPNGQIESRGLFKNNQAAGKWVWYYNNGMRKETGYFQNGKKSGEWIIFNNSGEIIENYYYIGGKKTTIFRFKNT